MQQTPVIPVLCGPTASGKTAFALELTGRMDCEVISADSRQIYKGMNIGTAKPVPAETAACPHHLIDFLNPDEPYSAGQFARDAAERIRSILDRGKTPLVAGGSGLYIRALIQGLSPMPTVPGEIREKIAMEMKKDGVDSMHRKLRAVDPESALRIDPSDWKKIVRALEVWETAGIPMSLLQKQKAMPSPWKFFTGMLDIPRPELYERINVRVTRMIRDGLFDEVKGLLARGYTENLYAFQSVGYRESLDYLAGRMGKEEAAEKIRQNTRQYAKRQLTWFRKEKIDFRCAGSPEDAAKYISAWKKIEL